MGDCMIGFEGGRPGDERGFVHKKLLGGLSKVASFLPIPAFASTLVGGLAGRLARTGRAPTVRGGTLLTSRAQRARFPTAPQQGFRDPLPVVRPPPRRTLPRTLTARPSVLSAEEKNRGRNIKFPDFVENILDVIRPPVTLPVPTEPVTFGPTRTCDPPLIRGPSGLCIAPTSPLGASRLFGEAVLGQYGTALVPGSQIVDRATCPRGTQLGNDGLCYNKGQITNKQRMWPAGRKPLLTGGDMNAIRIAARAGRRLAGATTRLQRLGMMPKAAAPRRRRKTAATGAHKH